MLIVFKLLGCLLSESGGEFMFRFCSGFISGQTGDMCRKPETESRESQESQESRKNGDTRKWKVENIGGPCGL